MLHRLETENGFVALVNDGFMELLHKRMKEMIQEESKRPIPNSSILDFDHPDYVGLPHNINKYRDFKYERCTVFDDWEPNEVGIED